MTADSADLVTVGWDDERLGYLSVTPNTEKLTIEGDTPATQKTLEDLVKRLKRPGQDDRDFLHELPTRLHSRLWARTLLTTQPTPLSTTS